MPKAKFLADMNISPSTLDELRKFGWDIVRVDEVVESTSEDAGVLEYARKHNQVVITYDNDFSALLALGGYSKPSVLNLHLENATPKFVASRIIEVVSRLEKELLEGAVVSVDEASARYRSLPIDFSI